MVQARQSAGLGAVQRGPPPFSLLLLLGGGLLLLLLLLLQLELLVQGGQVVLVPLVHEDLLRVVLEQPLEHAAGAAVLEALVGGEGVLGAVAPVAELAHVHRVRLLVLVLEVALQGVVAGEGATAVGALLGLVYAPGRRRGHPVRGRR